MKKKGQTISSCISIDAGSCRHRPDTEELNIWWKWEMWDALQHQPRQLLRFDNEAWMERVTFTLVSQRRSEEVTCWEDGIGRRCSFCTIRGRALDKKKDHPNHLLQAEDQHGLICKHIQHLSYSERVINRGQSNGQGQCDVIERSVWDSS